MIKTNLLGEVLTMLDSDYVKKAITAVIDDRNIERIAKMNGIYVEGDKLNTFTDGIMAGVFAMANALGVDSEQIIKLITGDEHEKH